MKIPHRCDTEGEAAIKRELAYRLFRPRIPRRQIVLNTRHVGAAKRQHKTSNPTFGIYRMKIPKDVAHLDLFAEVCRDPQYLPRPKLIKR